MIWIIYNQLSKTNNLFKQIVSRCLFISFEMYLIVYISNMIKFMENKTVTAGFLISVYVLAFICLSLSPPLDLRAQQRGTISVIQATALPLVNTEGNQVKVIINYSIGDQSIVGQRINAQMGINDRLNGT